MEDNEVIEVEEPQNEDIEQPQEETIEEELPEGVSERTKEQFDKLKNKNKELKNVVDSLRPAAEVQPSQEDFKHLDQSQIDDVLKDMTTDDGFIDGNKLMSTLKDMNENTQKALQIAEREREHRERERIAREEQIKSEEMRKVHEKYPELDPENDVFDEEYYDLVRNDLISQMMRGEENVMAAADKMSKYLKRDVVNKKEQEEKETKEEQKKQINASRPRSRTAKNYYQQDEEEALIHKVRTGKKGAVAEMLKRRGQ